MANGMNEDPNEEESLIQEEADRQRQLAEQMRQEEAALMSALPTQPIAPPAGFEQSLIDEETRLNRQREALAATPGIGVRTMAPPAPDTTGRMYMGPMIGQEQLSRIPEGGRINLMPPPSGPPPTALERLQALDRPGSETISIRQDVPIPVPEGKSPVFAAMQEWNRLGALGIPPEERARLIGPEYFLPRAGMTLTPAQQANLKLREEQINVQKQAENRRALAAASRESPETSATRSSLLAQQRDLEKSIMEGKADPANPVVGKLRLSIQQRLDALKRPAASESRARTTLGPNEEKRLTANGRPAVFDSKTKKFIRYAD